MRKIDRRIVVVISVIFILGLAWGLMKFLVAQKEPPPVRRTIEARRFVKAEPVKYTNISAEVSGPGRLASIAEIDIVSEASGKIEAGNVSLKKGASFSKGDVLFVVYPDEAILSLKARKSQYRISAFIIALVYFDVRLILPPVIVERIGLLSAFGKYLAQLELLGHLKYFL